MLPDYSKRLLPIFLERSGEKTVGAMPVRPQAQPLAGVDIDALRGEQLAA